MKHVYGQKGGTAQEALYSYDNEGRLLTLTQTGRYLLECHYQADGSKISVQTFDPSTIERMNRGGGGRASDSDWDFPQSGSGVPMGGNVTIIYDSAGYERTFRNRNSSIGLTNSRNLPPHGDAGPKRRWPGCEPDNPYLRRSRAALGRKNSREEPGPINV